MIATILQFGGVIFGLGGALAALLWAHPSLKLTSVVAAVLFGFAMVAHGSGMEKARKECAAASAAREAAMKLAYAVEVAREAEAAREIAAEATRRIEEDVQVEKALNAEIDELKMKEASNAVSSIVVRPIVRQGLGAPAVCPPCAHAGGSHIDHDFARRVQRAYAIGDRAPAPTHRAGRVR